ILPPPQHSSSPAATQRLCSSALARAPAGSCAVGSSRSPTMSARRAVSRSLHQLVRRSPSLPRALPG
ncbi:unnamed protein product, partial [Closterium sp. Naga37s-1]